MTARAQHAAPLFDLPSPSPGPVEAAARAMLAGMLERGELTLEVDGLLVAHVASLAERLDRPGERAYGIAHISRELREIHTYLSERRTAAATPARDPLLELLADEG